MHRPGACGRLPDHDHRCDFTDERPECTQCAECPECTQCTEFARCHHQATHATHAAHAANTTHATHQITLIKPALVHERTDECWHICFFFREPALPGVCITMPVRDFSGNRFQRPVCLIPVFPSSPGFPGPRNDESPHFFPGREGTRREMRS